MKIDRLIGIINYLLRYGKTSAQKLSDVFEVSTRTIMRDMDTLGQAGIPIQSEYGADGGYRIMDTYVMDKKLINPQDCSHIIAALKGLLSACSSKNVEQTLDKIIPLYDSSTHPISLDFGVAIEKDGINQNIILLEEAIRRKQAVEFKYTNNENVTKYIQAEPARLEFKWYNWYLIAFHPQYQDYCMFKLVRMEELAILEKRNIMPHEAVDIQIHDGRKFISVTLRGNARIKSKCIEYLNGNISKEYPNGDFEYYFSVPEDENYWYGVILSFGNNVTVLEPRCVIDRIVRTCGDVSKNYEAENCGNI